MNNNPIETKLLSYSEAPVMVPLQNWLSGFEFKSGLNTNVAVASNDKGVIVSVCYVKIDDAFLITAMEVNPKATTAEKQEASKGIDLLLEEQAQLAGITRTFIVRPGGNECEEVATYTPRITSVKKIITPSRAAYIN
jgi:hypothetical protein